MKVVSKDIRMGTEARALMLQGVDKLADADFTGPDADASVPDAAPASSPT